MSVCITRLSTCRLIYSFLASQRNRCPETDCNGAPSLSITTDFHVNFTETFSDVTRVFSNGNRRTLPYGTALHSYNFTSGSRDTSHLFRIQIMSGRGKTHHCGEYVQRSTYFEHQMCTPTRLLTLHTSPP